MLETNHADLTFLIPTTGGFTGGRGCLSLLSSFSCSLLTWMFLGWKSYHEILIHFYLLTRVLEQFEKPVWKLRIFLSLTSSATFVMHYGKLGKNIPVFTLFVQLVYFLFKREVFFTSLYMYIFFTFIFMRMTTW